MKAPLLVEVGCEEIPARMIPAAAADLGSRLIAVLDRAGVDHGPHVAWGGSRRLTVCVEQVGGGQSDRVQRVLGPPEKAAYDKDGRFTAAAAGFARKQGVEPTALRVFDTDKGRYVGLEREVQGKTVGELIAESFPRAVESMSFPKTMRWGDGRYRWVRPIHWVMILHGDGPVDLEVMGARAEARSRGHRFLAPGAVTIEHPDRYVDALRAAHVMVDPSERRRVIRKMLAEAAASMDADLVDDPGLLEEVSDLVEWPGVVAGSFDEGFLELPREILITTLRHHQKCFSLEADGRLRAAFLAVANTDRDPGGHIRRGNEWVVSGRLEDARFFWKEDRKRRLEDRLQDLADVVYHEGAGSYADKAERMSELASALAGKLGASPDLAGAASRAARLAKADLVTDLVGEFPELQGVAGALLLRAEGESGAVPDAVYEHYRPAGADDAIPASDAGRVVALADKLDALASLTRAGAKATGSKDPFGLRRACNGAYRIVLEAGWNLSLQDLWDLSGQDQPLFSFMTERLEHFLRDAGYTSHEIWSVLLLGSGTEGPRLPLPDVRDRLDAVRKVRERADFAHLVELTKRVSNIIPQVVELLESRMDRDPRPAIYEDFRDPKEAGRELRDLVEALRAEVAEKAAARGYDAVIELLSRFVRPVDRFFEDVLVIDPENLDAACHRREMLVRLRDVLTQYFDLRQLPGEAERS